MRIRIDIDISATELAGWLESIVAAPLAKPLPEIGDVDDGLGNDDWDFPDFEDFEDFDLAPANAEDPFAAESHAIAAAVAWAKGRMGGGHA